MKNTVLFIIATMMAIGIASAQDEVTIYAKKVSSGETPPAIVEAVKKDFPDNADAIKVYLNPENMVDSEWGAALDKKISEGEHSYYTVKMKGKKGGYIYGLYDGNGVLKVLKMEAVDFVLPAEIVTASTTGKYEGYKIKGNKYKCYKVLDKSTNKEYVQVEIARGKDKKTLYFTPQGEFIKEK
jgi:hypothetical protein